jgi:hypothetical protein
MITITEHMIGEGFGSFAIQIHCGGVIKLNGKILSLKNYRPSGFLKYMKDLILIDQILFLFYNQ